MSDNIIYGRFGGPYRSDHAKKMEEIITVFNDIGSLPQPPMQEYPPEHWSNRYVTIGDLASALTNLEGLFPGMTDEQFHELEKYLAIMLIDFGRVIAEEAKRRIDKIIACKTSRLLVN